VNAVEQGLRSSDKRPPETFGKGAAAGIDRAGHSRSAHPKSGKARLLRKLLHLLGDPPIELVLWDGQRVSSDGETIASVRIADRGVLFSLLRDAQLYFGDAFSEGRIEIEGDLVRFLEVIYHAGTRAEPRRSALRKLGGLLHRPHVNTLAGSRDNIHHHYDLGNDFYSLWLGRTMAYTCAYYPTESTTLDEAQDAKMHHVCRKLRLRPGETVVEAGFGWGTLATMPSSPSACWSTSASRTTGSSVASRGALSAATAAG
jgi:cyclopropane-fatty-acyl-phospholipid synthase